MPLCGGGGSEADRRIKEDQKKMSREIKVLLLGAGESGKSTIFKQMKIIHQSGFSKEEREQFKDIIYGNILKAMKSLVNASLSLDIPVEEPENRERAEHINNMDNEVLINVQKVWDENLAKDIGKLWQDPGIRKTYERRNEFQLDDSAAYYFSDIERISAADYIPTEQDVLRSRVKTTGIVETEFKLSEQVVKMIDVGGQRNERKKWIHCFEGVTAIIFVASLAEYDQKCYEDDTTNRMSESLLLFDEICNSRWFVDTSVILFLNKMDLFREKVKRVDLNVCFPQYTGGLVFDKAADYIKGQFEAKNRHKEQKQIYMHLTCATDTGQLQQVFNNIKDIILQKTLKDQGLM
jgi:GTPase SAR1 family protein